MSTQSSTSTNKMTEKLHDHFFVHVVPSLVNHIDQDTTEVALSFLSFSLASLSQNKSHFTSATATYMSSSPPPPSPDSAEHKARTKEFSREGRLSFRNFAEHQMRREFKEMAIEQCQEPIREFAQCAQEKGLLVVFSCRHLNKAINDCMAAHNSNEAFEKYKQEHEEDLKKRTIGSK